ncbi:SDR family oxidoreductase [Spirosoma utsteinense]|uniref:NAD(P)-dependent dehydrogenase (Short-subunit alcohol dehydrogenase family) n=1 Tax=Spirosoma utsteinense TaxID=2585773 RepID=A0ABR6W3R5_9BACT|nr:SDR family oxidoreductase [Spirosoma utsteinense]MBC3784728.1 NAD(P)-dependent dehydrogenase (short-subunit alcohol dehydrogenase family) [Spirosoma utsteinense]MBC3791236.1 NAD(P)-dependent dehydrogenase (short-subunit alcohol dehydrogenase family) [Spirosoma utsteinense]
MKTVLITGANKGIGLEAAAELARLGYFIYLGCRNLTLGQQALDGLHQQGLTNTTLLEIDVTQPESIRKAVEQVAANGPSLDVLINNAGIPGAFPQDASSIPIDTIRYVFETNFFGVIQVTQAFMPLLRQSDAPRIVNVSSGLGSLTYLQDTTNEYYYLSPAAYTPSKTVLNAYTLMLAKELQHTPFKVNVVDPGYTATDFNNNQGVKPVDQAGRFVATFATLDADGPTGRFFGEEGEIPW